ncbi:hypothetical protein ACQ86G_26425 [Roseateles chitinivorans]|uniref:hypothetical protein n=1 Tax=Roseateles chitinivorans TaxID=2917965 RepID=UPI003D67F411
MAENSTFEALVTKLSDAFRVALLIEEKKGRRIAQGGTNEFSLAAVDRTDDLGDFLSDDDYVLDIKLKSEDLFNVDFERRVGKALELGGVKWRYGIWSRASRDEEYRRIQPAQ